jgi:hypothetical protein
VRDCELIGMLIGTAVLSSQHHKRMGPGAGNYPAHEHRDCAQHHGICAWRLHLETAADGALNPTGMLKAGLAMQ